MTSQHLLAMALAWKSLARSLDPAFDDPRRTITGEQVHRLLNGLIDWLVGAAKIEDAIEECEWPECQADESAKRLDAARSAQG